MQIPAGRPKRKRTKKRGFFAISPLWSDRKRRLTPSNQPFSRPYKFAGEPARPRPTAPKLAPSAGLLTALSSGSRGTEDLRRARGRGSIMQAIRDLFPTAVMAEGFVAADGSES
jgi:hypothetical protein